MTRLSTIIGAAALAWAAAATPGLAANANNPYGNIDRSNDAGNDTGDSQVERLNEAQLNGGMPARGRPMAAYGAARRYPGYAPPGYAQSGYPPAGYARPGYGGSGYAPQGYPAPGYAQQGYPAQGYSQQGYPPPGYAQPGYPPAGY